ncbi:MAG: glycosyltransferase family 4 protein [Phycisphaeraceae bacterium]
MNVQPDMKVLMTTDTVGGVWTYAVELALSLRAEDVQVRLATMGAPINSVQRRQIDAFHLDVCESEYRLEWMADPWADVEAAGRWLLDMEAEFEPDVVHLNGYAHAALPFRAPTLVVAHSCVVSWWHAVHHAEPPDEWELYRRAVERGLQAADLVVAPTWAMLDAIERCYGSLPHVGVVSNGRDPRWFAPGRKEPFALAAGRVWDEAKNVTAVETAARGLPWPVYLAGETQHPVTGRVARQGLRPLGMLDPEAMAEWLGRASIFVHPARYEPFGLGVLEAALSGCALVLGDLQSLRELWDDAAVFVPPNDHEALRAAMARLMADDLARRDLARRACQRGLQLTPERMAAGYCRAYRQLVSRSSNVASPSVVRPLTPDA